MEISQVCNVNFGQNIKTHRRMTKIALKDNSFVSEQEKNIISQCSKMPDLIKEELEDMNSAHFYDVLHEDPSFGTKNDMKNNALSKFLYHNSQAEKAIQEANRDLALKEAGLAVHYLQDASTPPHVEHGNYFHKLFRLPMHRDFERGKKYGVSSRLDFLENHYVYEELPFSNLKTLFHNTALYTVQPENHVSYSNKKLWPKIAQRTFNRGVNASKIYLDYILSKLR